jgi:hypothetical protein
MEDGVRKPVASQQDSKDHRAWLYNSAMIAILSVMVSVSAVIVAHGLREPRLPPIDTRLRTGRHMTFVLIAPTSVSDHGYVVAVREAKEAMREHAAQHGYLYSTIGVSDAWETKEALEILAAFGWFDEMIVGRNWFNTGIQKYVDERGVLAAVPQVVVTAQHVRVDTIPFAYGEMEELIRIIGHNEMAKWSARGFPVNNPAITVGALGK